MCIIWCEGNMCIIWCGVMAHGIIWCGVMKYKHREKFSPEIEDNECVSSEIPSFKK